MSDSLPPVSTPEPRAAPHVLACGFCQARPSILWNGSTPTHVMCNDPTCGVYCKRMTLEAWNRRASLPRREAPLSPAKCANCGFDPSRIHCPNCGDVVSEKLAHYAPSPKPHWSCD